MSIFFLPSVHCLQKTGQTGQRLLEEEESDIISIPKKRRYIFPEVKTVRRSDRKNLKKQIEQIEVPTGLQKLNKMSLNFVLPLVLFYTLVGLLLIFLDELVTNISAWALAAGLVIGGAWLIIRYLRSKPEKRLAGADLAVGLALLLAGVLLICSPEDMKEVFPKIWGLSLVFGGFLKIQYAFDEKSVGVNRWWIMLIFAAFSLAIGVLALLNKEVFGENQHLVIGIFMLGEAVLDLVTYFLLKHGMKKMNRPEEEEEPEIPAEPAMLTEPETPAEPETTEGSEALPETEEEKEPEPVAEEQPEE